MSHVMNTYARLPVAFVRGEGTWLWDESGRKYLDALAGIAVSTLGHAHPKLTRALAEQAARVLHTSNLFRIPVQEAAADRIAEITGLDEVFFCNSGCEANEAAIKIARKYGHERGVQEPAIVVMEKAFHGRTLATLSATRQPQGAGGLRAAGVGLRARALQRPRRGAARSPSINPERGRGAGRADPGRRRHQHLVAWNICAACASCATATNGC